jgi:hypothetical protein
MTNNLSYRLLCLMLGLGIGVFLMMFSNPMDSDACLGVGALLGMAMAFSSTGDEVEVSAL